MANLTPEQLDLIRGLSMTNGTPSSVAFDGLNYQPVYAQDSAGQEGGSNPAMMRQAGNLEQIIGYDPSKTEKGKDTFNVYDPSGQFTNQGVFKDDDAGQMFAMSLLAALAMGVGLPGLTGAGGAGGAGTGALGTVAGDAFMPAALGAGGTEVAMGSVIPGLEAFAAPVAAGGSTGAGLGSLTEGLGGSLTQGGLNTNLLAEGAGFGGLGQAAPGISGIGSEAAGFGGMVNQGASFGGMGGQMFGGLSPELAAAALGSGVPESSGLLGTIKDAANNLLPKDFGFNAKSIASALPLLGTLADKPQQQGTGAKELTPEQKEMMNRPLAMWDWDRLKQDAASQGMDLGSFVSRNWNRVSGGEYNRKMARGGALGTLDPHNGRSDKIQALLSPGEYVMDAETVSLLGDGSTQAGINQLEQMRSGIRKHKGQALARGQFSPGARSALSYLKGGQ